MLAQAIFIVTSWKNPARQHTLRSSYLRDLSDRYFVRSERSFDLLQSLIVYYGWYVDTIVVQVRGHGCVWVLRLFQVPFLYPELSLWSLQTGHRPGDHGH